MRIVLTAAILMLLGASSTPSFDGRLVEYDVDGTANYADVTWNTNGGGTEQRQLKFPFHESFVAPMGMFAYISAQKVKVLSKPRLGGSVDVLSDGVTGTVHVTVHINAQIVGDAISDAPFGIAKASGKVE